MAEHHDVPLPVQQLLELIQPIGAAAQGQVDHGLPQSRQLQLHRFAHVHQLERLAGVESCPEIAGAQGLRAGHWLTLGVSRIVAQAPEADPV